MGCNASFPLFLVPLGPLAPDPRPCTTAASRFGLEVAGDSGLAILPSSHPCWPGPEQVPGEQRTSRGLGVPGTATADPGSSLP